MERNEHLQWAKDRAFEIIDSGDSIGAWTSFYSDLNKHNELKDHLALEMGTMILLSGGMSTSKECKKFIDGFN